MPKTLFRHLLYLFIGYSGCTLADITPYFSANKEINFGAVMPVPGNCTMSHENGSFSEINPEVMCGAGGNAIPGRYVIVANPNHQVIIKLLQKDNQGDGLMFIPQGELISDTETLVITAGIEQEIDSGTSGIINIHVGGRFFVLSSIAPASNIEFTVVDGIEWAELP